jgi:hypothetical protein
MRLGKKSWIGLSALALLSVLGWSVLQRLFDVAAVQDCLNRDWETFFDPRVQGGPGRPPFLPESLDHAVQRWINDRYAGNPRGLDFGRGPRHAENRDNVYHERFRALFRGTIREIEIVDPEGFRGDLGAALKRFPGLRRVTVHDCGNNDGPTEAEWQLLCERMRSLSELEELDIAGRFISDASVGPLAGHPALRTIRVRCSRLTPECAKTFRGMPRLATIYINVWPIPTPADQATWSAKLPGAVINDRRNTP